LGYDTYHRLIVLEEDGVTEVHDLLLNDELVDGDSTTIGNLINGNVDACHWYNSQEEMTVLSKKYPHYIFDLTGDGEDQGDIWNAFYWNGRSYRWNLEYQMPQVDVERLKQAPLVLEE
jgi:hypothetical protein